MKAFIILSIFGFMTCASMPEDEIVLVNIGQLRRDEIARLISTVNALSPKVIALDVKFTGRRYEEHDETLIETLWACEEKMVIPTEIYDFNGETSVSLSSGSLFAPTQAKTGFINTVLEDDDRHTLRRFVTQDTTSGDDQAIELHFAIRTAMCYDSLQAVRFLKSHSKVTEIDYKNGKRMFKRYSAEEIFSGRSKKQSIEGKIVIIGFLGPGDEDKFYTPLNSSNRQPDMYGVEYLANIVAQVLEFKD